MLYRRNARGLIAHAENGNRETDACIESRVYRLNNVSNSELYLSKAFGKADKLIQRPR